MSGPGLASERQSSLGMQPAMLVPQSVPVSPVKVKRTNNLSSDTNRTLLVCSNCDDSNNSITVWCRDCSQGSGGNGDLFVLCTECNIGLHKVSKMQMHRRAPFNPKLQSKENSTSNTTTSQLLCSNCESQSMPIAQWCCDCEQLQCQECSIEIHQPKSKKVHVRYPLHQRAIASNPNKATAAASGVSKRLTAPIISFASNGKPAAGLSQSTTTTPPSALTTLASRAQTQPNASTTTSSKPSTASALLRAAATNGSKRTTTDNSNKLLNALANARSTRTIACNVSSELPGDVLTIPDLSITGECAAETHALRNTSNTFDTIGNVNIHQLSVGRQHWGAVTAAGSLYMSGSNQEGQLGVGEEDDKLLDGDRCTSVPLQLFSTLPTPQTRIQQLACGYDHCIALTYDNQLLVWGSGLMSTLGLGSDHNVHRPTILDLNATCNDKELANRGKQRIVYVAAGEHNSGCIVDGRADGAQLFLWGANHYGQLGVNDRDPRLTPALVTVKDASTQSPVASLTCLEFGSQHTVVVGSNGVVYTCGSNQFGQLGYKEVTARRIETSDSADNNERQPQSPSHSHSSQTPKNTSIHAPFQRKRGKSISTRIGLQPPNDDDETPIQYEFKAVQSLVDQGVQIIQVGCGEIHTSALSARGEVWSWGSGETHQVGIWDNVDQFLPVRCVKLGGDNPLLRCVWLSVGVSMTCAVVDTGDLYCWGYSAESPVPVLVSSLQSHCLQRVEVGEGCSVVALTGIGNEVYEWKFSSADETDSLSSSISDSTPELCRTLRGKRIRSLSIGRSHSSVVTQTGKLLMMGNPEYTGIDLAADADWNIPREIVLPQYVIAQVKCSSEHSLALTTDGQALSWGSGDMGRLGHGNHQDVKTPTLIEGLPADDPVSYIAVGPQNSACCTNNGRLYTFGSGAGGQCGDGTVEPQVTPYLVKALASQHVTTVAFGNRHTACTTQFGSVYCWGSNDFGQLGLGSSSITHSYTPTEVKLMSAPCSLVQCGDNVTFALTAETGRVYGWGASETQQLGIASDGSQQAPDVHQPTLIKFNFAADSQSPTPATKITEIAVSSINCAALADNHRVYSWGWTLGAEPTVVRLLAKDDIEIHTIAVGTNSMLLST